MRSAFAPRFRSCSSSLRSRDVAILCGVAAMLVMLGASGASAEAKAPAPTAAAGQAELEKRLAEIPSGEEGVVQVLTALDERLTLSDEQKDQIRPIVVDTVADLEKVRDRFIAGDITPMALVMQMQMAGQKSATLIEPHLTEAQVADYAAMRQEQKQQMMKEMMKTQRAAAGAAAP